MIVVFGLVSLAPVRLSGTAQCNQGLRGREILWVCLASRELCSGCGLDLSESGFSIQYETEGSCFGVSFFAVNDYSSTTL
jgi:hypothetical protein